MRTKIIQSLENDQYKWRTLKGIARETGFKEDDILSFIEQSNDEIVQSSVPSKTGEVLYTTKDHFNKFGSAFDKLIGAFKGRLR